MATSQLPRRVAIDTGALLALASTRDQHHERARRTMDRLQQNGSRFIGHVLVLGELHGHLLRRLSPTVVNEITRGLLEDRLFEWVEVTPELMGRAMSNWIERYADQRFSLTDAVTFQIMKEARVGHAFAFDEDFTTAGFTLV